MTAVVVFGRDGTPRKLESVAAAVRYMVNDWPPGHLFSGAYMSAQSAALDISAGGDVDRFWELFRKAAREAGLLSPPAET